ncbi:MAG: lysophospholipid acyltransferase family protein [Desulforhopalus sp.]
MIQSLSSALLSWFGWRVEMEEVLDDKILIIGAPHTSNWDFPLTLLALSALGLRFSWIGKHTIFKGPLGSFFRSIGGIPVNRKVRSSFIDAMVSAFSQREQLVLAIAPEGTRAKKNHWKAGFYHIAVKAQVKICFGFIDYPTKTIGLGPTFIPSKNIVSDFEVIRKFYSNKSGKHPEKESAVQLRQKEIELFQREYGKVSSTQSVDFK